MTTNDALFPVINRKAHRLLQELRPLIVQALCRMAVRAAPGDTYRMKRLVESASLDDVLQELEANAAGGPAQTDAGARMPVARHEAH